MKPKMPRIKINELIDAQNPKDEVNLSGWIRTRRDAKTFSFIELNDGSCLKNIQLIAADTLPNYSKIKKLNTGSAINVNGRLIPSKGSGQKWEISAESIDIISAAPDDYPLQKKRHSDEFLRNIAHLRPRTNKYGATFRIRSELSFAIHKFFKEKGFRYIHTPIITSSDCEGAGEMFRVTTLSPEKIISTNNSKDTAVDFFDKEANLTVSGQLSVEMFALSLGDVYTFGPTFRAENSNTRRHVAEFWMIEPEMAFCDLEGNMALAQEMIKYLIQYIQKNCSDDLELFARFVDKSLMSTLNQIVDTPFEHLLYADAVEILKKSKHKFEFVIEFGKDLQSEHERFLTESYFKKPVIVYNYPKNIKPFYMRLNDDDQTVAAMDVLVPKIGEIIGGSQREERLEVLEKRMEASGLDKNTYWWYIDSRRFGSVPHSGFGMGFERMMMLITGAANIRDVIPYPRTPGNIEF